LPPDEALQKIGDFQAARICSAGGGLEERGASNATEELVRHGLDLP
jgi:hypothetical protein